MPEVQESQVSLQYCQALIDKLLSHAVSLANLLPSDMPGRGSSWDLSSISVLARCILEAYEALAYIAFHKITSEERRFRISLWKAHDLDRRLQMMELIPDNQRSVSQCTQWLAEAKGELTETSFFYGLEPKEQKRILHKLPAYHLSHEKLCQASEIDFGYFELAKMFLSQYVHSTSFAIHHLSKHVANSEDGYRNTCVPLTHAMVFLAKSIHDLIGADLWPISPLNEDQNNIVYVYVEFTRGSYYQA